MNIVILLTPCALLLKSRSRGTAAVDGVAREEVTRANAAIALVNVCMFKWSRSEVSEMQCCRTSNLNRKGAAGAASKVLYMFENNMIVHSGLSVEEITYAVGAA